MVELNEKISGLDHPRSVNILFNLAHVLAKHKETMLRQRNTSDTFSAPTRKLVAAITRTRSIACAVWLYVWKTSNHTQWHFPIFNAVTKSFLATITSLDADRFEIEEDITRVQKILDQKAITAEELEPQRNDNSLPNSATITTLVGGSGSSWNSRSHSSYLNPPGVPHSM